MEKSRSNSGEEQTGFKKVHKERKPQKPDNQFLQKRMESIAHKIVVLSGKGGVGKSTVAVNLAVALSLAGRKIGLLDVDMHGPSVPGMLHLETNRLNMEHNVIIPVDFHGVKVMSIGFLLPHKDDAVIWRGPLKMGVIRQFLGDVDWGDLDCLIIDSPPGTGDEPLSVCQLIGNVDGAIVVTTPQDVATNDGRKCINFCKQLKLPVLGVVENMSGFVCPHCEKKTDIFKTDGGRQMAEEMGVPFLGAIPLDPLIGESCDTGEPYIQMSSESPGAGAFGHIIEPLINLIQPKDPKESNAVSNTGTGDAKVLRFAFPREGESLATHFGHCEDFLVMDVDPASLEIVEKREIKPPVHQPGLLPRWLVEHGVRIVVALGMGSRAQNLFAEQGIEVFVGAPDLSPEQLVKDYLAGNLKSGDNVCDH